MKIDNTQYNLHLFKGEVVRYLFKIEETCDRLNVPMRNVTLIMRNPDEPEMYVVLTTEDADGIKIACDLAMSQKGVVT
jgi:hypothetical protein